MLISDYNSFIIFHFFYYRLILIVRNIFSGLEDQLLGRVILAEKQELETERTRLITDVTANKRKIKELETNLLHKLTTVQVRI